MISPIHAATAAVGILLCIGLIKLFLGIALFFILGTIIPLPIVGFVKSKHELWTYSNKQRLTTIDQFSITVVHNSSSYWLGGSKSERIEDTSKNVSHYIKNTRNGCNLSTFKWILQINILYVGNICICKYSNIDYFQE